ncbi:hypothetical protein PR202_gb28589 [Eleusine coracana subsp. coracana]|uniref:Transcription factor CBF/NF-Y/archaeal histone domain-containing protein n=1 Tax=Eleusine coracana subsp. coracana TaxID=191504 RepID=A0AAV5FX78_ELECO|nr:hypothetical protein PR202_gb28589 [Eleusine coracana subsp. coracana]
MEEQPPSLIMVNEAVTNVDAPAVCAATPNKHAALTSASPTMGDALPSVTKDAPVCPVTQQLAEQQQGASEQLHQDLDKKQLQAFWSDQLAMIEQTTEYKNHNLPLSRIKKIMKEDDGIKRIAGEAPVVLAKACEMFIQELTMRGWHHAKENKRRTVKKNDITAALARTEVFDFLLPSDHQKQETSVGLSKTTAVQEDEEEDPYANYYWECDCFSCPSSPDEPDYSKMSHDDPRYQARLFDFYAQL